MNGFVLYESDMEAILDLTEKEKAFLLEAIARTLNPSFGHVEIPHTTEVLFKMICTSGDRFVKRSDIKDVCRKDRG